MKDYCEGLEWNNGTDIVRTGALLTLNNAVENNATRDYINALNSAESSSTVYFAYAFIGLRKSCRHCSWHWVDNEPLIYTNWWGTEPNTWMYECAHIRFHYQYDKLYLQYVFRTTGSYDGAWIDMTCTGSYHAGKLFIILPSKLGYFLQDFLPFSGQNSDISPGHSQCYMAHAA